MKRKLKITLLIALVGVHIGLVVNEIMVIYFMNHLQYGTHVNGIDVGGWKVKEVEKLLEEKAQDYELVLEKRHGEEVIAASDIGVSYHLDNQIKEIKEKQYEWQWMKGLWSKQSYEVDLEVEYEERDLEQEVAALDCLLPENNIRPENAGLELVAGRYEIIEGHPGSMIKQDVLMNEIKEAIENKEETLSLEEKACYEVPTITAEDKALKIKRDALNQYVASVITYDFGDRQEVVDGEVINEWLNVEGDEEITLNEEAVRAYVDQLADTYNTIYGTRDFKTSMGTTVTVVGGDYGWRINREEETNALINLIKEGEQEIVRTPIYTQEGWCREQNDIGETYVEINLTKQYLWFYKEGNLIAEGSIVSGTATNGHATPEGTYTLDYKQANAVLRGPGYACPVSYWMPFNQDIGIHDATWRGAFGDSIYIYDGSHGCINTSLNMAQTIFNESEEGMPVVCYNE